MRKTASTTALVSTALGFALASSLGCQPKPTESSSPKSDVSPEAASSPEPAAEPQGSAPEPAALGTGSFVLAREEGQERLEFGAEQLVFCRWYAAPDKGDYVWVRLAREQGEDGDAGPRLDIDLCRVSSPGASEAAYAPMVAGAHGSHCADEPGFAVWWHEGEAAFNSGPSPSPEDCTLELDFDREALTMSGRFACEPLAFVEHGKSEAGAEPKPAPASIAVLEGSFRCALELK